MIWIMSFVGAFIGAGLMPLEGLVFGGGIGFLLGSLFTLINRVGLLEKQLEKLEKILRNELRGKVKEPVSDNAEKAVESNYQNIIKGTEGVDVGENPDESRDDSANEGIADKATGFGFQHLPPEENLKHWAEASNAHVKKTANATQTVDDKSHAGEAHAPKTVQAASSPLQGLTEKTFNLVKRYFTEGNIIVRVGIVVLFFGVSFLVKYSIDNALVPIEVRLASVVLGGIFMLAVGWRLRKKVPVYALVMQGGAIAVIYLAIFASFRLYHIIPASFAFPLLIVFSVLSMMLAVMQNSSSLAISAIVGGFASPILTSTGSGNYIALFSYYTVLNLSIFGVSWFKSWRMLNVLGFAFTFIIGSIWGVTQYKAYNFNTTEPFLIIFFLIYVAIAVLFAFKQKPNLKGYVDGTLVLGVPLVGFSLQASLVHKMEYGLAWSAFALGFFYLGLARVLWRNSSANFRLLSEAFLALGVIFATLVIPFAVDGQWTAAAWAVEGAGFVWLGIHQNRRLVKYFGVLVQLGGGVLYLIDFPYSWGSIGFINGEYIGSLMVSVAALVTAWQFTNDDADEVKQYRFDMVFLFLGLVWWYGGGLIQFNRHVHAPYEQALLLVFFAVSGLFWLAVNLRYKWPGFNFFPWLTLLPLSICFLVSVEHSHPFNNYGFLAWPLVFAVVYWTYFLADKKPLQLFSSSFLNGSTYFLLALVVCFEASWQVNNLNIADCWQVVVIAMVLIGALQAINRLQCWPFAQHAVAYQQGVATMLVAVLVIWSFVMNFFSFLKSDLLPYIPLLNPIDITQAIALLVVLEWFKRSGKEMITLVNRPKLIAILAGFCFIWFNVMLFKTIHVVDGVAYQAHSLFNSAVVQMTVSIAWTLLGLVIMVIASRMHQKNLWIVGATLTGVVVAKLFLLDLSEQGTVERIISFMVVGILLLVVGYFSPVPPKVQAQKAGVSF